MKTFLKIKYCIFFVDVRMFYYHLPFSRMAYYPLPLHLASVRMSFTDDPIKGLRNKLPVSENSAQFNREGTKIMYVQTILINQ